MLFGAIQDCGTDRWGRILIERAVRKKVLAQTPYRDIDDVLALDDASCAAVTQQELARHFYFRRDRPSEFSWL